jgi:uncharacterized integral membrane protein
VSFLRGLAALVVVFAMAAAGALFAVQNESRVSLDLLVYRFAPRSLALWVLSALALGGVLGLLAASGVILRLRARVALLRRQLARAQSRGQGETGGALPRKRQGGPA